ncbi:MAG: DUF483 domain-containing protein [Candidatus Bathyarchaeota archaeon]|nr:MAG: DUF483 domain-containing protein [Candidatus Bathyarchaeota archaeon]
MGFHDRILRRPKNRASILTNSLYTELLDETALHDYIKIEDYLMVAGGIRPCSFITIPAEFKDGVELGRRIDELCKADLQSVLMAIPSEKMILIQKLKNQLRQSFKRVVLTSNSYKAHLLWAKRLLLRTKETEVRPSIHELYFFQDSKLKKKLERLLEVRKTARKDTRTGTKETTIAYSEELSSEYLASLGKMLGYPHCCVKRYIEDRLSQDTNVEIRASRQIRDLRNTGEELDRFAYFVMNFFPCNPTCRAASELGKKTFDLLSIVNPRLSNLYSECTQNNADLVEKYPKLITQYREKLEQSTQKLGKIDDDRPKI